MDVFIILTVLHILSLNEAYNFTCPSQAHWNIRAKSMCKPPRNYTCLFNITFRVNVYRDRCNRPRILAPGYKYVFQPNLNRATCSVNRYQPFNFDTNGYSDCTFKKSLCNSLGQETYETGNTTVDRKCICNTNKGYTFVRKLQNQSYCNPSTEDCSCYHGINICNETIGLKDIKCYDFKMLRMSYLGDMLNITRTKQISEFDSYNYNIYRIPTNKYRIDAANFVLTLLLSYFLVWIIVVGMMRRWVKKRSKHMLKLNKLLKSSETENRYFVRVMIVGKESAGKTCLLRRLLNEGISGVSSTDGVDIIVRRCKINIEDGKWTIGNEIDDKNERINRALSSNEKTKIDATEGSNRKKYPAKSIPFGEKESNASVITSNDFPIYIAPEGSAEEKATQILQEDETNNRTISHFDEISSDKIHRTTETKENLDKNEPSLLLMPENLMSEVFSKSTVKTQRNLYALCELWDFAGQKEFYATHQAFLTSSAVYLVVADMENDIIKQDKSQFSADFQHIGDYIDFWFDSIHCHRTVDERASHGHFDPPILLVFTGKDKYNKADLQKRKKELNEQIDLVLGNQSKYHHLHDTFFLSNKVDTDKEFENFRFAIFDTARKKNNWGKAVPLKWFLLEHLIQINKKNGKNFISFTDMFQLAKHPDIKILEEEDLLLFLRFQHNVGNIIFFESIPDLIILNPQWLADAFRCLVSDRVDTSRLHHLTDWTLFKRQGKISESLITELFHSKDGSQFSGQKNNLHKVMEKFDILVKIENSNYYIMPSEMPSSTLNVVCEKFGILTKKCKRTSWLCFKFEFLPRSFFNHLSAWFIRKYDPSKLDVAIALYRGICMFDIESSGCKKILVTMSTDTIALQVVSFSEQEGFGNTCTEIYSEVKQLIEDIKDRYKMNISFKLHFKCSDGYYYKDTFEYEKLKRDKECFCFQHKKAHRSKEIYSYWTEKQVEKISDTAKISTEHDAHKPNAILNLTSKDNYRFAKCCMVVLQVFPMIMRDLMVKSGVPAKTLYNSILTDAHFKKKLNKSELDIVDTLQTDEYNKIDTSLSYKVIRHFQRFIPPPSRQWGANPIDTEIEIGDDIERIRQERNRFVHRVNDNISEVMFDNFFVTFIEVGKRIDAYLNKTQNNGYAQTVRQYKTCVVNPELEKQILDTRKEIEQFKENYIIETSGKKVHILIGDSVEAAIDAIREKTEEGSTNMKLIIHDVDDNEEMVKRLNLLKEDLNIEKKYFNGAEKGSIILFIDVKNRVVLDDGMFKSAPSTKNIFNFAMFTCDLYTQTYAAIASATEEIEELTINLPDDTKGKSLLGCEKNVDVNLEVNN